MSAPISLESGEPGSTGREVFEDSTASGPGAKYQSDEHHGTSGDSVGVASQANTGGNLGMADGAVTGGALPPVGSTYGTGQGHTQPQGNEHEGHHHHHHHHHHNQANQASGIEPAGESQIGDSYGSNPTGNTNAAFDRTGNLDQNAALYERTGTGGPITGGAAGTDRFDSDRGVNRTGATGNSDAYPDLKESTTRAEGKSSGGVMGVLATSDKDFTGRDRTGPLGGAYSDTHGNFQGNTSGPGGHSALTGREGNVENNPVAQAKSRVEGENTTGAGAGTGTGAAVSSEPKKEGLMEKIKHAVGA